MSFDLMYSLIWLLVITSGLMGGIYLTFSVVIMRSLSILDPANGIAAMNAVNREIVKTAFMPLFFGSTILSALLIIHGVRHWGSPGTVGEIAAGAIYFFGMFVVTAAGNVPLNNRLDQVEGNGEQAVKLWRKYLVAWTRWNTLRAAACIATMIISIDLLSVWPT